MTNEKFCKLLDKVVHNDISALKAIYEEYFLKIKYTALTIVNSQGDAYDVAMNVILKLIDYPSDPNEIHNHLGLLISMARREALNYIRHQTHSVPLDSGAETITAIEDENGLWRQDILNLLTEDEKLIFTEHCIWDKSLKVIGREKGIPYRSIVRIYAGIKAKIRQLYAEQ